MCGIFALLNFYLDTHSIYYPMNKITEEFMKGQGRGPESSILKNYLKFLLGFHRLAINGLNETSNQPLEIDGIVLICNGEIYNYKELYHLMNIEPETESDCEVIIHLYKKYGIEQTLRMIDGVFSFVLYDERLNDELSNNIYVARDPFGVRPMYYLKSKNLNPNHQFYGFASELKCLNTLYNDHPKQYTLEQFTPGSYSVFNISNKVNSLWSPLIENKPYFIPSFSYPYYSFKKFDYENENENKNSLSKKYSSISHYLTQAVYKRCLTTERPIACLLSGGLDSSLICSLVNQYYKRNNYDYQLETYSIGLAGSEDLKYARIVSDYLGTNHNEIIVTEQEMFDAIPDVIYAIESYDTTTVRASIGNYLLGKYISKNSNAKVIFNGDGSDELCGGYLYMNKCPDDIEFDKETRRLLQDIHKFDVLRSDKCISTHGLEPRTPFLDKTFVNNYLSIPIHIRNHKNLAECEKYLLRASFSRENYKTFDFTQILPDSILWRKKEAFSDGVSNHGRSLFTILQEKIALKLGDGYNADIDTEKYYYKMIFDMFFPNMDSILPYYWMPKYTNATDPSARTLEIYGSSNNLVNKSLENSSDSSSDNLLYCL